ncbi:MAG: S8 family serine peptidase, partial [Hydrogenovibrio sp.]
MTLKSTKRALFAALVLSSGVWLNGCGGSSSGGGDNPPQPPEPQTIDDPLVTAQWYLRNSGQSAYTESGQGGVPGQDINAFASSTLTSESYARGFNGEGVEIAIVDSGLDIRHEDLADNVIPNGSYNFNNGSHDPTPTDSGGDHGTSVAGLAAGR